MEQGEICLYGHYYTIRGNKTKVIVKNNIYELCLPGDIVAYDVFNDDIVVRQILSRKPSTSLAVARGMRNKNVFYCLPLISTIFNQDITIVDEDDPKIRVGDMWRCTIDIHGIHLHEQIGNAFNLRCVKDYIRDYVIKCTPEFKDMYENCINSGEQNEPLYTKPYEDLSHLDTFSVDNNGTRDIDDCISIDDESGKMYVHIVDIASGVDPGSPDDVQAAFQAYTIYLPDLTLPCLPRSLSEDSLSLLVGVPRRVITIEYCVDRSNRTISSVEIYPSTIVNKKNYTYEDFGKELSENFCNERKWVDDFFQKWHLRYFDIPNMKIKIKRGVVERVFLDSTYDPPHKFIETMMVLSNSIIAARISHFGTFFPRKRVPTTILYDRVPMLTSNSIVSNIIARNSLDSSQKATIASLGFYGLCNADYTHFTSPIRRQVDTIAHRVLSGIRYRRESIATLMSHIEKQHDMIRKITDWYYGIALKKYLREHWSEPVDGWVTEIYPHGIDFIIPEWMLPGYIHVSKLVSGIRWNLENGSLRSSSSPLTISKGTKIVVFHEGIGIINIKFYCIKVIV
jgi:exoribonuclease R